MKRIHSLLAIALVTLSWTSCSSEQQPKIQETPIIVETYLPVVSDSSTLSISGLLYAKNSAVISTRIMAYIEEVYANIGEKVRAGEVLIRLNANELNARKAQVMAQISEAEKAVENAQRDYKRYQTLHQQESVSDKELENMELNKTSMEAKLQMARQGLKEVEAMLSYTYIRAPFAGVITQKQAEVGNMAQPGMPLMAIEQGHEMEIRATVPENYIGQVAVGDQVNIGIKTLNKTIKGHVSELSPSSALSGGQYAMKVALDGVNDPELRSGMYANLSLPGKTYNNEGRSLWIDQSSLVVREQLKGVYIVNADNKAVLHWLRLGKSSGQQVEVLSGLNGNERIICKANGKLYNGRSVSVTK